MTDKRELILARLFVVLSGVTGITEKARNRGDLPSDKRPGIIMLDGDEVANRDAFGRGRPPAGQNLIVASPEIYIVPKNKKPVNETVGEDLNALRAKIVKAVLTDADLIELVGSNGEIRYEGMATDLGEDKTLEGKARLLFAFQYVLRPTDL